MELLNMSDPLEQQAASDFAYFLQFFLHPPRKFQPLHPADAEDLAQECTLRASRGGFAGKNKSRRKTWLYRIATNARIDYGRKQKRHRRVVTETDGNFRLI